MLSILKTGFDMESQASPYFPLKENVKYARCSLKYIRVLGPSMSKRGGLSHSVLEYIWIKGSYPDQILPQHESLYPIDLISARIKILHIGNFFTK